MADTVHWTLETANILNCVQVLLHSLNKIFLAINYSGLVYQSLCLSTARFLTLTHKFHLCCFCFKIFWFFNIFVVDINWESTLTSSMTRLLMITWVWHSLAWIDWYHSLVYIQFSEHDFRNFMNKNIKNSLIVLYLKSKVEVRNLNFRIFTGVWRCSVWLSGLNTNIFHHWILEYCAGSGQW